MPLPCQKIGKKSQTLPSSSSMQTTKPPPTCLCHACCCHCHISLGFLSDKGYFVTPRKHGSVFSSWSQHNITNINILLRHRVVPAHQQNQNFIIIVRARSIGTLQWVQELWAEKCHIPWEDNKMWEYNYLISWNGSLRKWVRTQEAGDLRDGVRERKRERDSDNEKHERS